MPSAPRLIRLSQRAVSHQCHEERSEGMRRPESLPPAAWGLSECLVLRAGLAFIGQMRRLEAKAGEVTRPYPAALPLRGTDGRVVARSTGFLITGRVIHMETLPQG